MNKPEGKAHIQISHWDETVRIEFSHHDISLDEVMDKFELLLLGAGFSHDQVKEYFDEN